MNRYVRPVQFAFEADVVSVFALISFGAAGAPTLNTNYSKGICNIALNSISITGTSANTSTTISSVSSFAGLYVGMGISDGGVHIPANTTISSMNPGAGTMVISQAATGTNTGLTVSGGQYTITFGAQFSPARLDPYVRLLSASHLWDEAGVQGGASTGALAPAAPSMFLVGNNITSSTLANLVLQFGTGAGASFVAEVPASGEALRLFFSFTRSTAV
jgi:hypothetical protein